MPFPRRLASLVAATGVFACLACSKPPQAAEIYTPGLGEIMTLNQMRHSKLWFAGEAGNWDLAAYELEELQEGLDDAARFHPTHKSSPLPIPGLIEKIMSQPMRELSATIKAHDSAGFPVAYDALTAGCNSCHQATNFGFNVVVRPSTNPFTNQSFTARKAPGP